MSEPVFVDTNVLVYSRDASEAQKQPLANEWVAALWRSRSGRLSVQVLHEYYVTVTDKLRPGMDRKDARADVRTLLAWSPVPLNVGLLERAWTDQDRFRLSWWDALIVAAARTAESAYLLSEDFQDGQDLGGLRVIDPFIHEPSDFV